MTSCKTILSYAALGKASAWKSACAIFLLCAATAIVAPAQTFETLVNFDKSNGSNPLGSLVQGFNGDLYGTTAAGGDLSCYSGLGCGTAFKITPTGVLTIMHDFEGTDGWDVLGTLALGTDGDFYGTTYGTYGTVFKVKPGNRLTTLYNFCPQQNCANGEGPVGGVIQATDGNFYGTTYIGGTYNDGAVFKVTLGGALTGLYSFCSQLNCADGDLPTDALVESTDGNLYGTTQYGGANNGGTVFEINSSGTLTTLYSFCSQNGCTDGSTPWAGLIQATDGNLYGTTQNGGSRGAGTVFKMTPVGVLTVIYSFCSQTNCTDGIHPFAPLTQANDGNLYGTTFGDSVGGYFGTVFEVTLAGVLTTLHTFDGADGESSYGGVIQATDGSFYGTTYQGGSTTNGCFANSCGTLFHLTIGLPPFVRTLPTSGKVGTPVFILGTNLTGATKVTFNGTAATFTEVSSTEIKTMTPIGATSGSVQVTTPSGTLTSNIVFRVRP